MVLPAFDYVDYVWDRGNKGENWELQLIQNKALRIIYKVKLEANPLYNTDQLHAKSKCFYLNVRRDIHLLSYAYILAQSPDKFDQRNIPTRRNVGKRLIPLRSFKPIGRSKCPAKSNSQME